MVFIMSTIIKKIKLINFKRFENYEIEPNDKINILVGDNELGKSSILEAIDIVASGNIRRVESLGIDKLLNVKSVEKFNEGIREFRKLPKLIIEVYLEGDFDHTMNGKNNTDGRVCDGIRLVCEANKDYFNEVKDALDANDEYFPYDYYSIRFSTFADEGYTGYKKKLRTILIDSDNLNSEYATNDYIKRMYRQYTESDSKERALHKSQFRQLKNGFRSTSLSDLNSRISGDKNYEFGLKLGSNSTFENELMIFENDIGIDSKGAGTQVFIKTDFALDRAGDNVDVILLEEPENHLSHTNLRKLIQRVSESQKGQMFITTHNSMISTRLELKNLLIMHTENNDSPLSLSNLSADTAKYFMKAPVANIIEFTISEKVILVEGPSEYILFEKFYENVMHHKPEEDGVHIMDIRGLSFKRYLEVAKHLNNKVAVITDNDGDGNKNCVEKYIDFSNEPNIKIFYDSDNAKTTFEKVLFYENEELCTELFNDNALDFMLKNKTESAFNLVEKDVDINVPEYIKGAITWINE